MKQVIGFILAVILVTCLLFQVTRHLVFGWAFFVVRVIPKIEVNWPLSGIGVASWLGIVVLIHHLGSWLRRQSQSSTDEPTRWTWQSSLCLGGFIVVMFCAGISAAGMAHQTAWLVRSPNPFWVSKIGRASHISDADTSRLYLQSLDTGINNYAAQSKRMPFTDKVEQPVRQSWPTEIVGHIYSMRKTMRNSELPWDDDMNRDYFSRVLPILLNPSLENAPQHDERGYGLSHYEANQYVVDLTYEEFASGTSQTLMIGEVRSEFQPWGKPGTHRDPNLGLNRHPRGFGGPPSRDTVLFLFADGSVRAVNDTIDPRVLEAMTRP